MSVLKVRLNKSSTDWHIARALLEDEYKVYLDKALDRVRTRYVFASHLLDVHRMWCAECSLSGCPAQPVRSDRDTCAPGSASGKQAGFQFGAQAMGIDACQHEVDGEGNKDDNKISGRALSLEVARNDEDGEIQTDVYTAPLDEKGIKQECHEEDESSQENANNKEQREEGTDEAWLDQIPHSHRADVQSLLDRTDHVSDIHILIKEEGPYQEYCDVEMKSSRNLSPSHQEHEKKIITQHSRSDVKTILKNDSKPPRSSYDTKEHGPETSVQAQCDAGIGEPSTSAHDINEQSPEDSAQDKCNTGGKTILEIESKSGPSNCTFSAKKHGPEVSVQAQCDASIGEPSSSAHVRNPEDTSQDECNTGNSSSNKVQHQSKGETLQSCSKKCTHSRDFDGDLKTQSEPKPQRQRGHTDGKTILEIKNKRGPFRCTCNTKEHGPDASVQAQYDARIEEPSSSAHGRNPKEMSQDQFKTGNSSSNKAQHQSKGETLQSCSNKCFHSRDFNADLKTQTEPKPQSKRADTGQKPNQCLICKREFITKTHLIKHTSTHIEERRYQCTVCNKAFYSRSNLSCHIRTHTGDKPFQCTVCNKAFTVRSSLTSHMRIHTGDKPYQCSICNKYFSESGSYHRHMRIHTGEKPYVCSVCNKAFSDSSCLSNHKRTHTGYKPYHCSVCYKAFVSSSNLRTHMRTHTGEKPYVCSVCNKAFVSNSNLTTHMRTHTGEKPYVCSVCHKAFVSNSNLTTHTRTHTGEKPYVCSVCNKAFSHRSRLSRHIITHTGDKPY